MTKKWQQLWDQNTHNKLYQVLPILKERKPDPNKTRKVETAISRQHIGNTKSTHSFIRKDKLFF